MVELKQDRFLLTVLYPHANKEIVNIVSLAFFTEWYV